MNLNRRNILSLSLVGFVILIALFGSALAYQVYFKRSDAGWVRALGAGLPAAKLGGRSISYGRFVETRDTVRKYWETPAAKEQGVAGPYDAKAERLTTIDRLLGDEAVQELADTRGVTVSDDEVRAAFGTMLSITASSTVNVSQYLADTLGWTEDDFRRNVVRPAVLESKVIATFPTSTDPVAQFQSHINDRLKQDDVKVYLKF